MKYCSQIYVFKVNYKFLLLTVCATFSFGLSRYLLSLRMDFLVVVVRGFSASAAT
jgi:hypothetical protein